jgi:ribosome-associated translation inhibitor RaiA
VGINCNYHSKQLVSNVDDSNLYKALGKSIESIKHQVLKKSQKLRKPGKESKS